LVLFQDLLQVNARLVVLSGIQQGNSVIKVFFMGLKGCGALVQLLIAGA
jgi:hypothetical protein